MGLQECGLPEDKLPQCWSDDVRMNALFAPFRLKSANPESWDMKMKFWSDITRLWCKHKNDPVVSAADLKFAFQRKGRTAACIDIVIEEMFRNGELCPISKYQQILHNGPEGWMWWGAKLAFKPAAIALTAVTSLLPARQAIDHDGMPKSNIDSTQRFVLESAVKDQATSLLNDFPPGSDRVGTIEDLMISSGHTNRETFEILLGYLVAQGMAVKKDDVVKLAEPNKRATPITELDVAVARSVSSERRLRADVRRFVRDIAAAEQCARAAANAGDRRAARSHLRRKHKVQARLEHCEAALDNVCALLQQARDADVNRAVVDTYRTSARAMKSTMKEAGLDEDQVHDTMDDLKEVMESYSEVERALGGAADDTDLADLERELNELLGGPGGAPGGGATSRDSSVRLPSPPEREFVFDGEEQMLAELNRLSVEDASPRARPAPLAEAVCADAASTPKAAKSEAKSSVVEGGWARTAADCSDRGYGELRLDERLHPGQPLNVDFSSPPRHYADEFQVRDHKPAGSVWIYSTDHLDERRPRDGQEGSFVAAPGAGRQATAHTDDQSGTEQVEDLERRLRGLRGFQL